MSGETGANVVAAITDHALDKYALLEKVLSIAGFFETLERKWKESGKDKSEFGIAVKPNLAMMLRRADVGTYTDPFLVVHLLRLLLQRGYSNLCVVESQNLYGNWFENRSVVEIAARAGYFEDTGVDSFKGLASAEVRVRGGGVDARVPLIDLTLDTTPHDFGEGLGEWRAGRAWTEADFRINFAKMKTHFYSLYTLAIKNIYGCLPLQDKVLGYHCEKVVGPLTARLIVDFPVHFSIVDGVTAADGIMGVKIKAICKKPHTIIAGADVMAVDHFGATLLGLDPNKSVMHAELGKLSPLRDYEVKGCASPPKPWWNSPGVAAFLSRLIEFNANIMDHMGALSTGGHDDCFPHNQSARGPLKKLIYYLSVPANTLAEPSVIILAARRRALRRRLENIRHEAPLILGDEFIASRLEFLSKDDLGVLAEIIEGVGGEAPGFSGHYLFVNGGEREHAARLSTSNLAMVEILRRVQVQGPDPRSLAGEFRVLYERSEDVIGDRDGYPYCYG